MKLRSGSDGRPGVQGDRRQVTPPFADNADQREARAAAELPGKKAETIERFISQRNGEIERANEKDGGTREQIAEGDIVESAEPLNARTEDQLLMLKGITGRGVFLYTTKSGRTDLPGGFTTPDTGMSFVRTRAEQADLMVFDAAHENAHNMPEILAAGDEVVKKLSKEDVDAYIESRSGDIGELSRADHEEELVCNAFGTYMYDAVVGNNAETNALYDKYRISNDAVELFEKAFLNVLSGERLLEESIDAAARANLGNAFGGDVKYAEDGTPELPESESRTIPHEYTYDGLTSQPDMRVTRVPDMDTIFTDGRIDRGKVQSLGLENAEAVGVLTQKSGHPVVENTYSGRRITVTGRFIQHGLDGPFPRISTNSRLGAVVGELVKNAVPVNDLLRPKTGPEMYAMIAYARDSKRDFIAIIHVDKDGDVVNKTEIFDLAYSLKGKTKWHPVDTGSLRLDVNTSYSPSDATITVSELLDLVKDLQPDILSEDVLRHYGIEDRPEGYYDGQVRYSDAAADPAADPTATRDDAYMDKAMELYKQGMGYLQYVRLPNYDSEVARALRSLWDTRRTVRILRDAAQLYGDGITPDQYWEQHKGDFDDFAHQVQLQLIGMYLRNDVNMGGRFGDAQLKELLKNIGDAPQYSTLRYGTMSPARAFENAAATRKEDTAANQIANYVDGERMRGAYFDYLMDQHGSMNAYMQEWGKRVAQAFEGGTTRESNLAQLMGERLITEAEAKEALYDGKHMLVPAAYRRVRTKQGTELWRINGWFVFDGEGHLVAFSDSERTFFKDPDNRGLKPDAKQTTYQKLRSKFHKNFSPRVGA